MKVIIPVAGRGSRVRPHSYSKPKPFMRVGKKTAIQYIIDHYIPFSPEEIIIVHDRYNGEEFKDRLPKLYPKQTFTFILQETKLGPSDALLKAKKRIKKGDPLFVNYCDTLFIKDLKCINKYPELDGLIFVKHVEDYQRFGVVVHNERIMTKFVEKPNKPVSKLASIALYYFKDGSKFMKYLQKMVDQDMKVKGEFYDAPAFMMMAQDGIKLRAEDIDDWLDVGKIETLLETNQKLLKGSVWKDRGVKIENCKLGENVSIGKKTTLKNCNITNSIIGENTVLEGLKIKDSIIGDNVVIKKGGTTYNIGDTSSIL